MWEMLKKYCKNYRNVKTNKKWKINAKKQKRTNENKNENKNEKNLLGAFVCSSFPIRGKGGDIPVYVRILRWTLDLRNYINSIWFLWCRSKIIVRAVSTVPRAVHSGTQIVFWKCFPFPWSKKMRKNNQNERNLNAAG